MAIYMKMNGAEGNVTSKGYEGWIQLESLDNGISRRIQARVGQTGNRERTIPSFQEIEITKHIDPSTYFLYQTACCDQTISEIEIHACSTDTEVSPYAKYILNHVMISHYQEVMDADKQPIEMLRLNFTKIQKTYMARDAMNKPQNPATFGFDLTTAKKL